MGAGALAAGGIISRHNIDFFAALGIAMTPTVAIAYLIVAVFLFGLSLSPASAFDRSAPHEAIAEPAE